MGPRDDACAFQRSRSVAGPRVQGMRTLPRTRARRADQRRPCGIVSPRRALREAVGQARGCRSCRLVPRRCPAAHRVRRPCRQARALPRRGASSDEVGRLVAHAPGDVGGPLVADASGGVASRILECCASSGLRRRRTTKVASPRLATMISTFIRYSSLVVPPRRISALTAGRLSACAPRRPASFYAHTRPRQTHVRTRMGVRNRRCPFYRSPSVSELVIKEWARTGDRQDRRCEEQSVCDSLPEAAVELHLPGVRHDIHKHE